MILPIISLLIYLSFIFFILKKYPIIFFLFFLFFFASIPNFISAVYLDMSPIYLFEFSSFSFNENSSFVLLLIQIILLSLLIVFYKHKKSQLIIIYKANNQKVFKHSKIIYLILSFIFLILYFHLFISTIPFFSLEVNKMNFWTDGAKYPILKPLNSQVLMIALLLGMMNTVKKFEFFSINFLLILLLLCYMILLGYKFGLLLRIIHLYMFPLVIQSIFNSSFKWSLILKWILPFIIGLFILIYFIYLSLYGNSTMVWDVLIQRILSMPAQVWNHSFHTFYADTIYEYQLNTEFTYLIDQSKVHLTVGMNFIMSKLMNQTMYMHYLNNNVILAEGYPQILFLLFNNLIVILFIITSLFTVVVWVHYQFLLNVIKKRVILSILWLKIILMYNAFTGSADLNKLLNFKLFLFLFLILIIHLIHQLTTRSKYAKPTYN